ncbi:Hypothetical protein, putative [Bodo saltans]|uniref:Uncharacterized protein n=1 Tax=Bodo saltans TaxID=75058 RepID=A0A0S4KIU8_BODSA|nr:Hypothetical protein, putative [Bodo saltans]|eukprot:CUI14364.1 Hypothetical protein, putative [Bodo saltans]
MNTSCTRPGGFLEQPTWPQASCPHTCLPLFLQQLTICCDWCELEAHCQFHSRPLDLFFCFVFSGAAPQLLSAGGSGGRCARCFHWRNHNTAPSRAAFNLVVFEPSLDMLFLSLACIFSVLEGDRCTFSSLRIKETNIDRL